MAYVAVPYFGNKALIVRSGSMQPAIGVGDLVVVKGANHAQTPIPGALPKYKVGDVVAFESERNKSTLITHRVSRVEVTTDKILYETKGDANNAPDNNLVPENKVLGKSMFTVPSLGKVFAAAKTREGFFALILAPAILVIIFEVVTIFREIKKIRRKKLEPQIEAARESIRSNLMLRILVPMILGTMFFHTSFASYADTEVSTGNNMQASGDFGQQPAPNPTPNVDGGLRINEFLPSPTAGQNEWVEFYNPGNFNLASYWLDDDTDFTSDVGSSAKKSLVTINNADPTYPYLEFSDFLNNGGDSVVLFAPDGSIVDQTSYGSIGASISVGRSPNGSGPFQNCAVSTKGLLNGGC